MTYPKAPIQEAIFDIKVGSVENTDIKSYELLKNTELKELSEVHKQYVFSGRLKFNIEKIDVKAEKNEKKLIGVVFSNKDSNIKVQFRKDGFTLNMLRPYSTWEEFSSLAFKYWSFYKSHVKPKNFKRIALRYINRIEIPVEGLDFDDYFNNMPSLPNGFEDAYHDLLLRTVSLMKDSGNPVILTRRMESPNDEILPFIIDIDAYKDQNINYENLEEDFETLRRDKNKVFESLISDKTRKLFK